mgnify:CR=1 FL=1
MAYKINRSDEHIVLPDGPATVRDVQKYIKQRATSEFYELEAAEVIEVWLDEEDLPLIPDTDKRDWSKYGWISARMSISNSGLDDFVSIRPLDANIKEYPYPGEHVIVASYYGEKYYTQKLNINNSVNINSFPALSKVYDIWSNEVYKENLPIVRNEKIRQIDVEEGDITFNGRFGNSIRLGSNVKEIKIDGKVKEDTGKENSPNVIIRAGQGVEETVRFKPVKEDINKDDSSLWMTTDQVVPFERSSDKAHGLTVPKQYDGKQILINSDRIVFNSKLNSIHAFSKNEISMAADIRMNLESPIVNLADREATEPAIAGDQLMDNVIWPIVDALVEFANGIAPTMATCIDIVIPLDFINSPSKTLASNLTALKAKQKDSPKSSTVFVGNPKGPKVIT